MLEMKRLQDGKQKSALLTELGAVRPGSWKSPSKPPFLMGETPVSA